MRTGREVAVIVYRRDRFLLMRQVRDGFWNIPAGGVERQETDGEAARRELREETGLTVRGPLLDLRHVQAHPIGDDVREYPPDLTSVTLSNYAATAPVDWSPTLSAEHDEFRWCSYEEALALLHWPEAKGALTALVDQLQGAIERQTARAVVLADGAILLLRYVDDQDGHSFWATPGGGVAPGETHAKAARRELWEETGFLANTLEPCNWTRETVGQMHGLTYRFVEQFFLVRVPSPFEVKPAALDEGELIRESKWWHLADLARRQPEEVDTSPRRLAKLVELLVAEGSPVAAIDVGV